MYHSSHKPVVFDLEYAFGIFRNRSTSGYVLWINGRGYMIDPPPYASMILQAFNIRCDLKSSILLLGWMLLTISTQ